MERKNAIIIEHTGVEDILKGNGARKELVVKTLEFAQEKGVEIIPLYHFAKRVIDKIENK